MTLLHSGLSLAKRKIKWRLTDKNVGALQRELSLHESVLSRYSSGVRKASSWNFNEFRDSVIGYVDSCKIGNAAEYGFCSGRGNPSLYTATYALMTRDLVLGHENAVADKDRRELVAYFDGLQDPDTGYFIDPSLEDGDYRKPENREWWGYGHVLLQVVICYVILGVRPRRKFAFLAPFYEHKYLLDYLEGRDWGSRIAYTGNELMNLGVALQYARDFLDDADAGKAVEVMRKWLVDRVDPKMGVWGEPAGESAEKRSQSIQGAYHIWPILFYDRVSVPFAEAAVNTLLRTQNSLGGYGCNRLQSTGCEDMDSIEPLYRFSRTIPHRKTEIDESLRFALPWLLANQNDDGGFVFSPGAPLRYGHSCLCSEADESNLFATWWRTLSLAFLTKSLGMDNNFHLTECPGMAFAAYE